MIYRYYIGLQLSPGLSAHITGVQRALYDKNAMITPLEPHITLIPPPAFEHIPPDQLAAEIKAAAMPLLPLQVSLTEVIPLGNHAIVIDVASKLDVASKRLHKLREALAAVVPPHRSFAKPFRPHVTLAQAARGKELPAHTIEAYKKELAPLLPASVIVPNITLFIWQKPRTYTAEAI